MPIYEYACTKCGHQLEVMQKISDKPLTRCPECRGKLEKLFSQTSFQLKGAGWYVTDYSKSGGKADKKTDTATDTKPEKKAEETKSEKKTEPAAA
jgi:putative FmdB family regulatory protein